MLVNEGFLGVDNTGNVLGVLAEWFAFIVQYVSKTNISAPSSA